MQSHNTRFILFVVALYFFRFIYCLHGYLYNPMWLAIGDESHVYLLGLDFYTSGIYPYWGPDIVYNNSFLVGGLQGILIGLPLYIWHHPFAPYLFLYILLAINLIYLSWYISKIFTNIKKWVIYSAIALAPFAFHTGLKVINPAYVLCFSTLFMLSFVEECNFFEEKKIRPKWRFFWLGLGVTTVFQIHASWILLLLMMIYCLIINFIKLKFTIPFFKNIIFVALGLFVGALTLLPTIFKYGLDCIFFQTKGSSFSIANSSDIITVIYNFLNLIGYEMNSFSGDFLFGPLLNKIGWSAAIIFGILQIVGILLAAFQVLFLFKKSWKKYIIHDKRFLVTILLLLFFLGIMFMFSFVRPGIHAMICLFPLSALFLIWFINNLKLTKNQNNFIFSSFFSLVILYYLLTIVVTDKLPDLGYRAKAFDAISKMIPKFLKHQGFNILLENQKNSSINI